jgi:hypothetical protein
LRVAATGNLLAFDAFGLEMLLITLPGCLVPALSARPRQRRRTSVKALGPKSPR